MNEELQNALAELINSTMGAAGDAKEFLMAETPEVIRQLLVWKLAENLAYTLIGAAMIICAIKLIKPTRKALTSFDDELVGVGGIIAMVILFLFGSFIFLFGLLNALQIWLAPKVYLLEYAAYALK